MSNAQFEGEPFTEYPPQVEALGEQIREIKERREKLRIQIASLHQVDNPFSPVVQDLARYKGGINASSAKLPGTFVESIYLIRQEFAGIQQAFANLLHNIAGILPDVWESSPLEPRDDLPEDGAEAATTNKEDLKPEEVQLQRWENFAALRFVAFIRGALTYMRHAMIFLGIAFSLVLISLNLYSFEPHQTLLWSFTSLFVVVGVVIVRVLLQVHRDHILSRTTDTKPNEAGLEFYLRVVSVGALPLLTLIATHFPSLGKGLLSLFQPGLEALK